MRFPMCAALLGAALVMAGPAIAQPLTLGDAVRRAIAASPTLRATEEGISAERAGRMQAEGRPAAALSVEAENFVGTGPYGVFSQGEVTVSYGQTIERGGKRAARMALADRGVGIAEAQARVARLDLAQQVQRAFIDAQIAGEVLWLAEKRLISERAMRDEALRRVRGYKDPLFVESRANARVADAQLALKEAEAMLKATQAQLKAFWGDQSDASLELPEAIEKPDQSLRGLAAADAALANAAIEAARAGVVVQQADGVQDYSWSGGARYLRGTGDVALVAGVSIPLGGNRNLGNIERAQAQRRQMELAAEGDRLDRLRRLASLRAQAEAARMRAEGIMQDVYPSAAKALEQVREGYGRGGFQFNDVQEAANAIVEAQAGWVEAMTRYRDALSEIDRLTGRFDAAVAEELVP